MVANVALQAASWYNKPIKILFDLAMVEHPRSWINLFRRFIVDTISPCPQDNNPQKFCKGCKNTYPATLEFFPPEKKGKNGLSSRCRVCTRARQKVHRSKPEVREYRNAYMKEWHARPEIQEKQRAYNRRPDRIERTKELHKGYRNQPETQARIKAYYQRPEVRERMRLYYNQPHQKARRREYLQKYIKRAEVQEHRRIYSKAYYSSSEVHARKIAWSKEYWKRPETKQKHRSYRRNRRAHKMAALGTHTQEQIREQYNRQKGRCYYCRQKVGWKGHHVDHVIPLSRGGSNDISNLVITCARCNLSKNDKLPHEFPDGGRLC